MIKENFVKIYSESFRNNWELPALRDYFKDESFTYGEMAREIAKLHIFFEESGIKRGDKIALIGRNNPRWCIAFLAITTYGAVVVPILQDFSGNDIQHIINHSESRMLFCGDQIWDLIDTEDVPMLLGAVSLTDYGCIWQTEGTNLSLLLNDRKVDELFYEKYPDGFDQEDVTFPEVDNADLIQINYTSGTTGFSKGVMLTGNNLVNNILFAQGEMLIARGERLLSFLPLAHAYGCMFDFLYPISVGVEVTLLGKIPSPKILLEAMSAVRPHLVICVPLIIEKVYKKQIMPLLDKSLMKIALKLPILDESIYAIIRKKLMDAFGGNFCQIVAGGAPLNAEVEEFMKRIKFPITVGYGMTECAPLISYASHDTFVPLSCGRPITGMKVRIDSPDPQNIPGEILVHGEGVMLGYYKNEQATKDAFTSDGWLRTGDVGTMDEAQNIHIRGRNKTMILRANGQNIYPEEIEAKLNNLPCVLECLVIDRGTKLVALVHPDYDQVDLSSIGTEELRQIMDNNLKTLNELVAPYERVAEINLYPNEFEKTPKKSIKRYLYNV